MSNIIGVRNNNTIVPLSSGSTMPAGTIIAYSGSIAAFSTLTSDSTTLYYKDGWAVCNGASLSQTTFVELYARIAATWNTAVSPLTGSAQSAPTSGYFRIPNLQGTFLRGVGDFSDNTKDTTLAGFQADQLQGHEHNVSLAFGSGQSFPAAYGSVTGAGGTAGGTVANYGDFGTVTSPSDDGTSGTVRTGTETRSQNIGVYYLIKLYDNLAAVDVYIAPQVPGVSAGLVPAQGLDGRTDGAAVPAGKVGHITSITDSNTSVSASVSNSNLTSAVLNKGVYTLIGTFEAINVSNWALSSGFMGVSVGTATDDPIGSSTHNSGTVAVIAEGPFSPAANTFRKIQQVRLDNLLISSDSTMVYLRGSMSGYSSGTYAIFWNLRIVRTA